MKLKSLTICLAAVLLCRAAVLAEEKTLKDFPRSGMLAVAGESIHSVVAIPAPIGAKDGAIPLIAGSVSRSPGGWDFKVFNNSKARLSISVEVSQYGAGGVRLGRHSFTYRVKPGERAGKTVEPLSGAVGCTVDLTSWKEI